MALTRRQGLRMVKDGTCDTETHGTNINGMPINSDGSIADQMD